MSLTHVFFAEPGGAVVTVRLSDEPSGFEAEPETWVEPNKCKLLCNRDPGEVIVIRNCVVGLLKS